MANLSAIVAAKAQAQKLRQIAADGEPGLGNRNQVGAGAETHLERTSRNGAVVKVRRESTHAVPGDCAVPVGVSTSEAPQVPAVAPSFTQGVRAALSSLIPASSKSAWYSSARTSSGTDTGYDESPATLQLIAAVLEDNAEDVEAAIEAGAHINGRVAGETPADSGQTAVIKAVRLGCLEVLDLLMQKGADPYMKDDLFRDAWYYACFGINMKDGDHQTVMSLMLMYWELEQDVLLLAMHSPHPGVRREALNALDVEVVSRDAKDNCIIRFNALGMIDAKDSSVRFPDGSRSQPGLSPWTKMIQMEAMESVSHPSVMAVIWWKWKAFGRMCLLFDLTFYLAAVISTSAWAIRYKESAHVYMVEHSLTDRGLVPAEQQDAWLEGFKTASLVTTMLMLWEETMLVSSVCIKTKTWTPIFGRFLHSLSAIVPVLLAYTLHIYGLYEESAQVLAVAVITIWLRVLYFAKFTRGFGAFCITLIEMIRRDLMKCLLILLLVLPGFVIAISLLVQTQCAEYLEDEEVARWGEEGQSSMSLIFMMLGTTGWYSGNSCLDHPVANLSTILFLMVTMIVLLNLLIAMFSDTYERIQGSAVHTWALHLAEYIMQKEIWMSVIGYRSRWVLMAKSEHAEAYEVRGKYQDYFLPILRTENGDERVEDHILAQLQALAEVSKLRYEEMSGRMKRIERSFMAEKIKTAAASALKGALGGGGGGAAGLLRSKMAASPGDGGLAGAVGNTETAPATTSSATGASPQKGTAHILHRVTAAANPRASVDLASRNQWAAYEADSQDLQRIQKNARPGRKSTARERPHSQGTKSSFNAFADAGNAQWQEQALAQRTGSSEVFSTQHSHRGLRQPEAPFGATRSASTDASGLPGITENAAAAAPAVMKGTHQMMHRVAAKPRASMDMMSRNQWAAYEADSQDLQRIQKNARPGRKSTAIEQRLGASPNVGFDTGTAESQETTLGQRTSSEARAFAEELQRGLHEPATLSRRTTAHSNLDMPSRVEEEDEEEAETAPLMLPGAVLDTKIVASTDGDHIVTDTAQDGVLQAGETLSRRGVRFASPFAALTQSRSMNEDNCIGSQEADN